MATAIESIYRDLEYARSLIKHTNVDSDREEEADTEHSTIRNYDQSLTNNFSPSSYSSNGSVRGAPSEDWSVISDSDDRRSSHLGESHSTPSTTKRSNIAAAVLSVLPDTLSFSSPKNVRG